MDPFESLYDGGRGESLDRELARPADPHRATDRTTSRQILKVPDLPGGLELPELRAASVELDRVRAIFAGAQHALHIAEAQRPTARATDAAAGAQAFRDGETVAGPTAVATLEAEIVKLATTAGHGRTAVLQCELEVNAVLDANRSTYLARVAKAIEADRLAAAMALDDYIAARATVLADLSLRAWFSGGRKVGVGQLPALRGISSHDRPTPTAEAVLAALRAELAP